MRPSKTAKQQGALFSVNGLAHVLGRDRATIARITQGLQPAREDGAIKLYRIEDVEARLREKPGKGLREEKLQEEIRKLRLRNDRDEGKVVARVEIANKLRTVLGRMRQVLEQRLVNELPTAAAGLEPAQLRIVARRYYDEAMAECRNLDAEIG